MSDSAWKHDDLAADLAQHLRSDKRMVWTDIRDEVWKIKGDGTPASRKERYAKIHPQNLKLAWVKIVALNQEIATLLAQPLVVPYRIERLDD